MGNAHELFLTQKFYYMQTHAHAHTQSYQQALIIFPHYVCYSEEVKVFTFGPLAASLHGLIPRGMPIT
jgi:hypothetical protein